MSLQDKRTGETSEMPIDGTFVFIGLDPNTAFLRDVGIRLNKWGFVVTGHELVHDSPPQVEIV